MKSAGGGLNKQTETKAVHRHMSEDTTSEGHICTEEVADNPWAQSSTNWY